MRIEFHRAARIALLSSSLILLAGACCWCLIQAWRSHAADSGTPASILSALRFRSGDAALLKRYAAVVGPDESASILARAVVLNPRDSNAWMQLGLLSEARNDFDGAEVAYRQAARANRQFQPSWTLSNYFYRRQNLDEASAWAVRSLQMVHGDPAPLFQLCWRLRPDPATVLEAVPHRRDVLREYLAFLTAGEQLEAAASVARRLLVQPQNDDVPNLTAYCERLLGSGFVAPAIDIWNQLCERKAIPYRPLHLAERATLTNGSFERPPSSMAFDWRVLPWPGIEIVHSAKPAGLRIALSGLQPESCEILTELVPVLSRTSYHLRFDHRTRGFEKNTGMHWSVFDVANGSDLAEAAAELGSEAWDTRETRFTTGPNSRLVRLALIYRRAPGTTLLEGSLWLRNINLD
jgi:tetratricopeptide (TPR) repeat protein